MRPDGTDYEFSHILVRDAAYDRLLKRTRARLHERYADWLLKVSGTRAAEFEEIIGYHLEQSFRYRAELGPLDEHARTLGERAARHLGAAGSKAIDHGDMPGAASLLQRAAALLDEGHPDQPRLLLWAGEALGDAGELAAADATLEAARIGAALLGNDAIGRSAELAALHLRYTTDSTSAHDSIVARVRELLPVLEEAADHHGLVRAWRLLTYAYMTATQWGMAAEAAEQTIRHAEQAGDEGMATRFVGMLAISVLYGPTPVDEAITYCEGVLSRAAEDRKSVAITEAVAGPSGGDARQLRGGPGPLSAQPGAARGVRLAVFGCLDFPRLGSRRDVRRRPRGGRTRAAQGLPDARADGGAQLHLDDRGAAGRCPVPGRVATRSQRSSPPSAGIWLPPNDVGSQFLWRCVQAKLLARDRQYQQSDSIIAEAIELIGGSDWVDGQGDGFMDLAEICRLRGRISDALAALAQASARFAAKGNVVSARRADKLAGDLRATLPGAAQNPAQQAAQG